MSDIIDIVAKLTYQLEDKQLTNAITKLKEQAAAIDSLKKKADTLRSSLSTAENAQQQKVFQTALDRTTERIDRQTTALKRNFEGNAALQRSIREEVGLIEQLTQFIQRATQERATLTDPTAIRKYSADIAKARAELTGLTSGGRTTSLFSGVGSSVLQGIGFGTGIGLVTQGVSAIRDFVSESSDLAAQLEGVQRAFALLNKPDLLENLRGATKGTLSDLELMKKAIQFNNFGLPVDKLATALEFARRRAKDTGDDINYITDSLVNGIARQSPRILDNLGINIQRVQHEFQLTGNFAEAAFKIIHEESLKAGADIETFAEKQARLNATIQNKQAEAGGFFNEYKAFLLSIGQDVANAFGEGGSNLAGEFVNQVRELKASAAQQAQIQQNSQALFLQDFKSFSDRYKTANLETRSQIQVDSRDKYNQLLADAKVFYKNDIDQFNFYAESLKFAFQTLNNDFKAQKRFNLNTISVSEITGLSKEGLETLQQQIADSRNVLNSSDKDAIERYNKLGEAITKNLNIINGTKEKGSKKDPFKIALDKAETDFNTSKLTDEVLKLLYNAELANNNTYKLLYESDQILGRDISEEERRGREENYSKEQKRINNLQEQRLNELEQTYVKQNIQVAQAFKNAKKVSEEENKLRDLELKRAKLRKDEEANQPVISQLPTRGQFPLNIGSATGDRTATPSIRIPGALEFALFGKSSTIVNNQERIKDEVLKTISAYEQLAQSAQQAFASINAAQINQLNAEISIREQRVANARVLAEQGNADALRIEEQRLEETIRLREIAGRREATINAALALSYAIAAVAKSALDGGGFLSVATVAATVSALIAGYALVKTATTPVGFADGGYTGNGGKYQPAGIVHKGEFVMPADKTNQYRGILEAMHSGMMPNLRTPNITHEFASKTEMKGVETKLDMVIEAIELNKVKNNITINERGIAVITEKQQRYEKGRFI